MSIYRYNKNRKAKIKKKKNSTEVLEYKVKESFPKDVNPSSKGRVNKREKNSNKNTRRLIQ